MAIRAIPNGDERDKDVANAIRYAVDNGARIINMSFGKRYSPHKKIVIEAFQYAESKGVLLVHAAGNDSENIDLNPSYPSKYISLGVSLNNWLEVGASAIKPDKLAAGFSNYSKKSVDLFAPGDDILSTPPNNEYKKHGGTSMAAPVVLGVAALALSQYPELDVQTLKQYLLNTVRACPRLQVVKPGADDEKVNFSDLSSTGGVVDAYALMQALSSDLNNSSETKINDIYNGYLDDPRALENCIAKTNISSQQNNKYYYVFVPTGTKTLKLSLTDGEGNADLMYQKQLMVGPLLLKMTFLQQKIIVPMLLKLKILLLTSFIIL